MWAYFLRIFICTIAVPSFSVTPPISPIVTPATITV
ncbi:unannotated protein [freshwater metagenome]|uniref:Unannotated protein n=1 Tax=freshwater metagenome TaxID=449393 RepID=A0A6J7RQU4_9ZZZZ